ncbi:MAG: PilZ domain-containing protein [Archangiaceae bacterium]|nr:PilZ domain-containing protein [Archangiaceae bacterium]
MLLRTFKRKYGRAPLHVTAQCTLDARRIEATVWQIGEGGLFVELPQLEPLPKTLAVSFELPGLGLHRVVAAPVWATATPPRSVPAAKQGAGCEFKDVSPKTKEAVAAYVKKMKETYRSLQFALALDRPTPQLPQLLKETDLANIRDRKELKERVAVAIAQMQTA